jgi:hypothetical protein
MAEWLKAAVLKTASRKSGTWVRILLPPPAYVKASAGKPCITSSTIGLNALRIVLGTGEMPERPKGLAC